jgi:hypothetical protein
VQIITRPFAGVPTLGRWKRFVQFVLEYWRRWRFEVLVLDPLACVFPGRENDNDAMREAILPMNAWKNAGLAILLGHHNRKNDPQPGQMARGAGALGAFVDIILEMKAVTDRADERRRQIDAYSRYASTPRVITLELSEDLRTYQLLEAGKPEESEHEGSDHWPGLVETLKPATDFKNVREILQEWPLDHLKPAFQTLYKLLNRAVEQNRLVREGKGTKDNPYLYALPHQPTEWLAQRREQCKQFGLSPVIHPVAESHAK